jgi:hypothetical protein
MNILNFLFSNWDSVLIFVAIIAILFFLIVKKEYAILDKILFSLVTEAEKWYGSGTGAIKLAAVIDWVYPKIPAVIRAFITAKQLTKAIERILKEAKEKWDANPKLSTYIEKPPDTAQ